jgi:hypothetical protein
MECQVCFQPECSESIGAMQRPRPGAVPTKLQPGEKEYRGYGEWAITPDEAQFVLHRGYAIVNGKKRHVHFIQNEAYVAQVYVDGTGGGDRY